MSRYANRVKDHAPVPSQPLIVVLLATWIGLVMALLFRTTTSVSKANLVRRDSSREVARALAEELAWTMAWEPSKRDAGFERFGFKVEARRYARGKRDRLVLEATAADGTAHKFRCEVLEGGFPMALRRPLSIAGESRDRSDPEWGWLSHRTVPTPFWLGDSFPKIVSGSDLEAARASRSFRVDDSLALFELPAGTDRRDWVVARGEDGVCRPAMDRFGVVVLDGHLWLVGDGRPIVFELTSTLTVIVRGNVYIDSPVIVRGRGRLIVTAVTATGAESFADLDWNGRWSSGDRPLTGPRRGGPIEGAGSVYIGLPGRTDRTVRTGLSIDAGLVVTGQLHVDARSVRLADVLVLGHGVTHADPDFRFEFAATDWPEWGRERIAGFEVLGRARPTRLVGH